MNANSRKLVNNLGFIYAKPPCKECEDRYTGCHTKCSEYIEWDKARKEAETKVRKRYDAEKEATEYTMSSIDKNKRKYHR